MVSCVLEQSEIMDCCVEFYMTVCACSSTDRQHRSMHNSLVASRVAEMLSAAANAAATSNNVKLEVTSCCSSMQADTLKLDHPKHFVLIRVSKAVLQHCISDFNRYFACGFVDEKNVGMS